MSESDLDRLYERASGHDPARPSTAVRQAILDQARELAAHTQEQHGAAVVAASRAAERRHASGRAPSGVSRRVTRWWRVRWLIAAPVAAAVLAVIVLQPQLRSKLPAPARQVSASAGPVANRSEPVRPAPANVPPTPPPAARARSAPQPFPAEAGPPQSDSSSALVSPTAPPAPAAAPPPPPAAMTPGLANSAKGAVPESGASAARLQARRATAPPVELRERAEAEGEAALAPATSESTLLQQAAARGDVMRVRSLLQMESISIDARDASGRTALLLAVLHRHEEVARALLERGADPNIADADGRTPLAVARDQNQGPMVEALLQAGAR
jgi:hypothetical protein